MSRAETLAGLTEAIAGHDFDNDRRHPTKGLYYCTCGEVIDVYIEKHHAAVALAWLEGHEGKANKRLTDAELAAEWYAAQLEVIDAADDGDDVALYVYATRMAKLRRFALHGHYDEDPEGD